MHPATHGADARPAANPSPPRGNPATPQTALTSVLYALDDGDLNALTSVLWADEKDPSDDAAVDAMNMRVLAVRNFRQAFRQKFRMELPRDWAVEAKSDRLEGFAVATATFARPYFDRAVVPVFGQSYRLVRDGKRWLVDASSFFPQGDSDVEAMGRRTAVISGIADEVTAGKFEAAQDSLRALHARLNPEPSADAR